MIYNGTPTMSPITLDNKILNSNHGPDTFSVNSTINITAPIKKGYSKRCSIKD